MKNSECQHHFCRELISEDFDLKGSRCNFCKINHGDLIRNASRFGFMIYD